MAARTVVRRPRTPAVEPTERPTTYGVEDGADIEPMVALLKDDHDDKTKPYCTCTNRKVGFCFDPQIGVYVHGGCWRPSKSYYEAALQAGVLEPDRGAPTEPVKTARRVTRRPRG